MGIRNIVNTERSNSINPTQIIVNGKPIKNPKDVSSTFNNFFTSIGPNTEQTIPKSKIAPRTYLKIKLMLTL